ncbi:phosphotransferase system PTS sorbose-specific IIC subunit [Coriobacterium glomerans PW2]|uniref:Phosphotransferase system PTS sorbose-specific IIC subunit n=1 Tax=Coriobacterium glomerans (strain ATCC 49209 / DSM 20642 / JCM 10262 / PW2) TaxID=700015 RepID=F2NAV9_CORGP|nr:PTS sugar transporter subunit IIC [Coriobacterium glomerans]AEB07637.1 phosphotransferase system PTS sorbose-specific IIC subunit [Coriobacterium glomerans PW2]
MIQWWQILLLTLYAAYQILDELGPYTSAGQAVFAGLISGLVMGDVTTGLFIGGSMQLMVLGVGTFGGASRIDANSGTVLATAFAVALKWNPEQALTAIGVPVAALLVYTDILGRFANTFWVHRIDGRIEEFDYAGIHRDFLLGALSWALSRALPVFLALTFGQGIVEKIVGLLQGDLSWLAQGLTVAGGALPAVGFAILLRYLPVKRHIAYLLLGFVIAALLGTVFTSIVTLGAGVSAVNKDFAGSFNNLSMLTIAIIGLALSILYYKGNQAARLAVAATADSNEEVEDDEL